MKIDTLTLIQAMRSPRWREPIRPTGVGTAAAEVERPWQRRTLDAITKVVAAFGGNRPAITRKVTGRSIPW